MKQKYFESIIDELGRIIIPSEIMVELGLKEKDALSISLIDGEMALFPADKMCFICCRTHNIDDLHDFGGNKICSDCIVAIDNNELVPDQHNISGYVRRIDELSRFVLPIAERNSLGLKESEKVFIYVDEGCIFIKPAIQTCYICHNEKSLMAVGSYTFCADCMEKISNISKTIAN